MRPSFDYDPYGRRTKVSGSYDADFGYTGHFHEQPSWMTTGLNLTMFRAYDPELGRWLSRDPIGEEGGLNLYGYVGNDPCNIIDELGLQGGESGISYPWSNKGPRDPRPAFDEGNYVANLWLRQQQQCIVGDDEQVLPYAPYYKSEGCPCDKRKRCYKVRRCVPVVFSTPSGNITIGRWSRKNGERCGPCE